MKGFLSIILFIFLNITRISAGVIVIGEITHEKQVRPGEQFKGSILLRNTGEEAEEVKIYQTDYLFFFDGSNAFGEPGNLERSNANWITFSPARMVIPAGGEMAVNYEVSVPERNDMAGTYWSMIMVEPIPRTSMEHSLPERSVGITTVVRYGIQIVNHIGRTGIQEIDFVSVRLVKNDEGRFLQVDIENTGERWVRPLVWVELFDETGVRAGKFESSPVRTYPGTSVRRKIDLTDVLPGQYKAIVIADGGSEAMIGAEYNLRIEE